MFRWIAICVTLCALTGGIVYVGSILGKQPITSDNNNNQPGAKNNDGAGAVAAAPQDVPVNRDVPRPKLTINRAEVGKKAQPFVLTGGHVQPMYRQEVGAEHNGKLVYLATDAKPGEPIPEDKKLQEKCWMMCIRVPSTEVVPDENKVIVPEDKSSYRKWKESDGFPPALLAIGYQMKTYRKLVEGDPVEKGQLLALIDPELQRDDLRIKISKLDVAESELQTSIKTKEEAKTRYDRMYKAVLITPGAFAPEEVSGARLTWERYIEEEQAKRASRLQAQRELAASMTILRKHEVRADVHGVIKVIYKRADETVKELETILQIQNLDSMRIDILMDVQDLRRVQAAKERGEQVIVEPTVADPPLRILQAHQQEVHGVAVSKALKDKREDFIIVSVSEDGTARGWDLRTGGELWYVQHGSALRSVACTGKDASRSLALVGAADGVAWIVDLDKTVGIVKSVDVEKNIVNVNVGGQDRSVSIVKEIELLSDDGNQLVDGLKAKEAKEFKEGAQVTLTIDRRDDRPFSQIRLGKHDEPIPLGRHHQGAVLCVAFTPNGKVCATSGEDRAIYFFDTKSGEQLKSNGAIIAAHRAPVTSLQFATNDLLVSAGRDNYLNVWSVKEGVPVHKIDEFERRGGEVAQLGVSPDGKKVLFDHGKELQIRSIATRQTVGSLKSYGTAGNFTTMALFSPDGKTIMTANAAEGKLQLWRTPTNDGRAGELREFLWNTGADKCGAFAPNSKYAVTGTQDNAVLVWEMPTEADVSAKLTGRISLIEWSLDAGSSKQVRVWVDVDPGDMTKQARLIPGSLATIVLPPAANP